MNIYFTNNCSNFIILNIDDGEPVFLQPFEKKLITRNDLDSIKILAKRNCESTKKSAIYHLVIETEYVFSDVSDNTTFIITREKIQFSLNASYDRLFLQSSNAKIISEKHKILAEDKIKKTFKKSRFGEFVFDTLMFSPALLVALILAGISLTFIWGWIITIIYFPLAFLFVGILNWLIDKLCIAIGKKVLKTEDENIEFYKYFENDFINNYYSNANRTPFMGNIER